MKIERIQHIEPAMIAQLVNLEQEAFGIGGMNEWHLVPFIRHGRVYIAQENDRVLGLIQYMRDWENLKKAYLMGVSIAKEMRGRGKGTTLMQKSLRALKKEGIEEVELTVSPDNSAALKIYSEKFGFVTKEYRLDEYGRGENRLQMVLLLADFQ